MREKEEEEFNQSGVCVRGTNAGLCLMSTLPRYCPEPAGLGAWRHFWAVVWAPTPAGRGGSCFHLTATNANFLFQ